MADPKVLLQVRVPPAVAEKLRKMAHVSNTTQTDILVKLIGEEDDIASRRAQTSVRKVKA